MLLCRHGRRPKRFLNGASGPPGGFKNCKNCVQISFSKKNFLYLYIFYISIKIFVVIIRLFVPVYQDVVELGKVDTRGAGSPRSPLLHALPWRSHVNELSVKTWQRMRRRRRRGCACMSLPRTHDNLPRQATVNGQTYALCSVGSSNAL